jgi:hypothetical protein
VYGLFSHHKWVFVQTLVWCDFWWLAWCCKSLGLSNRKQLVELKLSSPYMPSSLLSVNQQCRLLGINRSGLYYKPRINNTKQAIKNHITQVFEQIPIYGEKISALARKVFFQFCRFCGRMLCLLAICTRMLSFCLALFLYF